MTPFESLVFIQDYLSQALLGFAFEHNKPGNHHYHIYLFGVNTKADSIRKTLGKYMPAKTDFAVSTTAGPKRLPLDPKIAYQYAKNPDSYPTRVWVKGLDDITLEKFEFDAGVFYNELEKHRKSKAQKITEILVLKEQVAKPDHTWERLITELMDNPDMYVNMTLTQVKSKIAVSYLRQLKAVPRTADLHRYALSLLRISQHNLHKGEDKISDTALVLDYA